jgi:hypothetical protein
MVTIRGSQAPWPSVSWTARFELKLGLTPKRSGNQAYLSAPRRAASSSCCRVNRLLLLRSFSRF